MGSLEQVQSCHTEGHTLLFGTHPSLLGQVGLHYTALYCTTLHCTVLHYAALHITTPPHPQGLAREPGNLSKLTVLPCGGLGVDSDTYWNELHTARWLRKGRKGD